MAHPQNPYPQQNQQYQQLGMPPVIINNSASSSASAAAGGYGWRPPYRRQSVGVHILLFMFTAGIGNIIYAMNVSSWNRRNGF
ncbi:hypothetical protein [Streptomyces yangpuensis]|uniref:hypothetical protein n=1 Tax=Streptomyces yangpuensis TaxID=1648182 RepID=UPI000629395B|nr:hypothetical protein [Streptomyces yangpuensis]